MNPKTKNIYFITFILLMIGSLLLGLYTISHFILPIIMGCILALLLKPVHNFLKRSNFGNKTAATGIIVSVIILALGPLAFFVARAVHQGIVVGQGIAEKQTLSFDGLIEKVSVWEPVQLLVGDTQQLELKVRQLMGTGLSAVSTGILAKITDLPDLVVKFTIILLVAYFLLIQGRKFLTWVSARIPIDPKIKIQIGASLRGTSVSVVWATLAAAVSQTLVVALAFLILGVPSIFLAIGLTFILAWIPIVGSSPVWLGAMIYLYTQGSFVKMGIMLAAGLMVGILDNIVRTIVLRGRDEMSPAISLIAILGGLETFGIFGVFIGPILAALIISILKVWPSVAELDG